jgi:hypothetical protein
MTVNAAIPFVFFELCLCSPNTDGEIRFLPVFLGWFLGNLSCVKGLSVICSVALLVLAQQLSVGLKRWGLLPVQSSAGARRAGSITAPAVSTNVSLSTNPQLKKRVAVVVLDDKTIDL